MNRRHVLLGGSALAASSLIGSSCQLRTPSSTPVAETPASESAASEPWPEASTPLRAADVSVQLAMAEQVMTFLQVLDHDQQPRAVFPFISDERVDWHYTPRSRQGIPFKEMSAEQRQACDRLLQLTLSETGYQKFQNIVTLETVLRDMGGSPSIRDPERYFLTVFGDPTQLPWGWRMEGHHFSLNVTIIEDEQVSVTPTFWGANPALVEIEPHRGLRSLAQEQDLAFELLNTLTSVQQDQVVLVNQSFGDILTGPGRAQALAQPTGLRLADMTSDSRNLAVQLIETYVQNLTPNVAEGQWQQIQNADLNLIQFAWAGALEAGQAHYYRLHGPTVLIEYDNTRNNANHIHTIWRNLTNDFGGDVLRAHYEQSIHS